MLHPVNVPTSLPADADMAPFFGEKFAGTSLVAMPPTWKSALPAYYTFAFFREDLNRAELSRFFSHALELGLQNPRPVSRSLIEMASLFHPMLYARTIASNQSDFGACLGRGKWNDSTSADLANARTYMQSLLFLAGCTLSAAVIQDRFSAGNIESKLSRLWQAAQYARRGLLPDLNAADLEAFVIECAGRRDDPYDRLIDIKKTYSHVLGLIGSGIRTQQKTIAAPRLTASERERFDGVVDLIHRLLPREVLCIIAYGSAVTSADFSDYDLILVVRDGARALRLLAGLHPSFADRELNISVYDCGDFPSFQRCSGDNLDYGALCIDGETTVPVKPPIDLLFRNFSFAFIRLRQLLGMAAYLSKEGIHADTTTTSLYNYFVKIPMHIIKGVRGSMCQPIAKEAIAATMRDTLAYDLAEAARQCTTGEAWRAITDAYHATHATIHALNAEFQAFGVIPDREARA